MGTVGGRARAVFPALPPSRWAAGVPASDGAETPIGDSCYAAAVTVTLGSERPAVVAAEGSGR